MDGHYSDARGNVGKKAKQAKTKLGVQNILKNVLSALAKEE